MTFRITGLSPEPFRPLFGLPDAELAARGIVRKAVTVKPGFPCRITLDDAEPGARLLRVRGKGRARGQRPDVAVARQLHPVGLGVRRAQLL